MLTNTFMDFPITPIEEVMISEWAKAKGAAP